MMMYVRFIPLRLISILASANGVRYILHTQMAQFIRRNNLEIPY